jgi:hypothetical protein
MSFKNLGQTSRWVHRPHEYDFASEHDQGRKNTNADALSSRPCPVQCAHWQKVDRQADSLKVRFIAAVTADGRDSAALRREQLAYHAVGQILQEVEAGQRPESCRAQWKSLVVRDGVTQRHWESANRTTKTAKMIFPRSKLNDVLAEIYGRLSGGHLGVNIISEKIR